MSLYGLRGQEREVNLRLLDKALEKAPSIFVDAANCADPHLFPTSENLQGLFILPAESLYRLKPTLENIYRQALITGSRMIFISTFTSLFDYADEKENQDIFDYSWHVLKKVSEKKDVIAGVGKKHEKMARKHGIIWVR